MFAQSAHNGEGAGVVGVGTSVRGSWVVVVPRMTPTSRVGGFDGDAVGSVVGSCVGMVLGAPVSTVRAPPPHTQQASVAAMRSVLCSLPRKSQSPYTRMVADK